MTKSQKASPVTIPLDPLTFGLRVEDLPFIKKKPRPANRMIYGQIRSLDGDTLVIRSYFVKAQYQHHIILAKDNLQLTCSCGLSGQICKHTIGLIYAIVLDYGLDYFKQFYLFPFNNLPLFNQFTKVAFRHMHIILNTKKSYGHLFNHSADQLLAKPEFWEEPIPLNGEGEYYYGYTIAVMSRSFNLPFLIPYQAKLNFTHTAVKGYHRFVNLPDPLLYFNEDQRLLNSYSEDFKRLQLSEADPEIQKDPNALANLKIKNTQMAFNYWKQLFPVLMKQAHIKYYRFPGKIAYRIKPPRDSMYPLKLSDQKIVFSLKLEQKTGYFTLSYSAYLNNKPFKIDEIQHSGAPFFFTLKPKQDMPVLYLFNSMKEAAIIKQLKDGNDVITILEEDLSLFNTSILNSWAQEIPIDFQLVESSTYPLKVVKKMVTLHDKDGLVYFTPTIQYDQGEPIPIFSEGTKMLEISDNRHLILERDKAAEADFITVFLSIHPEFQSLTGQNLFYLTRDEVMNNPACGLSFYTKMIDAEITIAGIETIPND